MARKAPQTDVLRALFARSGNQCAFPGCTQPIINHKNKFIGQVCHIEAAMEGGERYNLASDDEYRRGYGNLLILCYPHHIETDDVIEYPVDRLRQMKNEHEQLFEKSDFKIDEAELVKLSYEMEKFWVDIDRVNKKEHFSSDSGLEMEVNGDSSFFEIMISIHGIVDRIENMLETLHSSDEQLIQDFESLLDKKEIPLNLFEDITYHYHPFIDRNWELHNLGTSNVLKRVRIDLAHIEVKYYEEYLKTNSDDLKVKSTFEKAKKRLKEYAQTAIYVD